MRYDHKIELMPEYRWPADHEKDAKRKRIWQVTMIERNDMGEAVRDVRVIRNGLTWDEAASVANRENQELRKAERENPDK